MAAPEDTNDTITTGGTAEVGITADPTRAYILVQNNDAAEDMWIRFLGTAATDVGIKIAAGQTFEQVFEHMPSIRNAMSIIAATTGHKFGITTDVN